MEASAPPKVRRQFERKAIKATALIYCRGSFQRAKVVDYSQGGLQLEGTFGLIRRDAVELELVSGKRLSGPVAWSLGCQTGVVFSQALPPGQSSIVELLRKPSLRRPGRSIQQSSRGY
jgi:hypothetical protein